MKINNINKKCMIKVKIQSIPVQEGDVRRGGCERRITTFFGLGGALKGLKKGNGQNVNLSTMYKLYILQGRGKKIIAISKTVNMNTNAYIYVHKTVYEKKQKSQFSIHTFKFSLK